MISHDADQLTRFLLDFAKRGVAQNGDFIPFAAAITDDGVLVPVPPMPADLDDTLAAVVAAGGLRALAWCITKRHVTLPGVSGSTEAIVLFCEDSDGAASVLMVPYHLRGRLLGIHFGEPVLDDAMPRFFRRSPP